MYSPDVLPKGKNSLYLHVLVTCMLSERNIADSKTRYTVHLLGALYTLRFPLSRFFRYLFRDRH
jgi:hypothetical protein